MVSRPAASKSPGNLLEMQIFWFCLRPNESETLGGVPRNLRSKKPSRRFKSENCYYKNTTRQTGLTPLQMNDDNISKFGEWYINPQWVCCFLSRIIYLEIWVRISFTFFLIKKQKDTVSYLCSCVETTEFVLMERVCHEKKTLLILCLDTYSFLRQETRKKIGCFIKFKEMVF